MAGSKIKFPYCRACEFQIGIHSGRTHTLGLYRVWASIARSCRPSGFFMRGCRLNSMHPGKSLSIIGNWSVIFQEFPIINWFSKLHITMTPYISNRFNHSSKFNPRWGIAEWVPLFMWISFRCRTLVFLTHLKALLGSQLCLPAYPLVSLVSGAILAVFSRQNGDFIPLLVLDRVSPSDGSPP